MKEEQTNNENVNKSEDIEKEIASMRNIRGFWAKFAAFIAIAVSTFHFYTSGFGLLISFEQRSVHLALLMVLAFVMYPFKDSDKDKVPWYDILLAALGSIACLYIFFNHHELAFRAGMPEQLDLIMGGIAILMVLEATRRSIGIALPIIASTFLVYAYLGPYMPGLLAHRGFSLQRIISHLYLTTEGIFGIPIGVSATFVFMFVLFGAVLEESGIGEYLIKVVFSGLGHQKGGPAKAAVVASGLMGMISGSSIANTVTTGSFTIPIMKKMGFKPEVAGGIEVAASTNGQFLPPIMGAAAFIMIEFTGLPYFEIIRAAFIPAILSYVAIFGIVHLQASKTGLEGIPKDELAPFFPTLIKGIYFILPIIGLVYLLVIRRATALGSAYWAIIMALTVSLLAKIFIMYWCKKNKVDREDLTPEKLPIDPTKESKNGIFSNKELVISFFKELIGAFESGAKNMIGIAMACACAGIIIGVVTLSGLGLRMTSLILTLSRGNLFLTLVLTMFASLILGLGLPTTAKYIIVATLTAPALTRLGVPMIAAHLFILYFGVLADDTPPVGLAAYAAAAVAGSDPVKTGLLGFKFDLAAFILPFIFVYSPMMLMIDVTWYKLIWIVITALIGMYAWSAGVQNYFFTRTRWWERIGLIGFAVLSTVPDIRLDVIGLTGIFLIYVTQRKAADLPLKPSFLGGKLAE
ncbi:MAG: TRAP transporter permease [Bacillota bacterium]